MLSDPLVIASRNVHKVRELRLMLKKSLKLEILSLLDFPNCSLPEESGKTFEENALQKALFVSKELGVWALGDDSGLVVPALDGRPGLDSAQFAGAEASDKQNRKKLMQEMAFLKEEERFAYFVCCLALVSKEGVVKTASAQCEGTIVEAERGGQGFGYDSLFMKHDYNKTFAELEEETKNRISHRRKALDKLLLLIQ